MTMTKIPQVLKTTMAKVVKCFFAFYGDLKSVCITVDELEKCSFNVRKSTCY